MLEQMNAVDHNNNKNLILNGKEYLGNNELERDITGEERQIKQILYHSKATKTCLELGHDIKFCRYKVWASILNATNKMHGKVS